MPTWRRAADKVVLGRVLSARLFGDGVDPVAVRSTIDGRPFTVVGWMRAVDATRTRARSCR